MTRMSDKDNFLKRAHEYIVANGPASVRQIVEGTRFSKRTGRVYAYLPTITQASMWLKGDKRFDGVLEYQQGILGGPYKVMMYEVVE
jgi:hypothetical protein